MVDEPLEPLISVVICAYSMERYEMTLDCINSIFQNTYKNYEIILVIDGNRELKKRMEDNFRGHANMTIIENENNEGPSISRNRGIERTKGEIIAFIDDDGFASTNWLEHIVKDFYEYKNILVVGGKLFPLYENSYDRFPEELLWIIGATYKGHPEKRQTVRNVFTGNMAVRKNVFDQIKFETTIGDNYRQKNKNKFLTHQLEDTFFCSRLNDRIHDSVLYDPNIIAYHHIYGNRSKLLYILKRSFSEGMLKAKLDIEIRNKVLSHEHNYLKILFGSIIKNVYILKIRDAALITIVTISVISGYMSFRLLEKLRKHGTRKITKS